MKKYLVVKEFYKLSDAKTYNVGDFIELTEEEAKAKKKEGLIVDDKEVKEPKVKKPKND